MLQLFILDDLLENNQVHHADQVTLWNHLENEYGPQSETCGKIWIFFIIFNSTLYSININFTIFKVYYHLTISWFISTLLSLFTSKSNLVLSHDLKFYDNLTIVHCCCNSGVVYAHFNDSLLLFNLLECYWPLRLTLVIFNKEIYRVVHGQAKRWKQSRWICPPTMALLHLQRAAFSPFGNTFISFLNGFILFWFHFFCCSDSCHGLLCMRRS